MAQYRSAYTGQQIDTAIDTVYNLAEVATSGDYDDLINKPSIPQNVPSVLLITYDGEGLTYSPSITFTTDAQWLSAILDFDVVILLDSTTNIYYNLANINESNYHINFSCVSPEVSGSNEDFAVSYAYIWSSQGTQQFGNGGEILSDVAFSGDYGDLSNVPDNEIFWVNFRITTGPAATADKTFEEVTAAFNSNKLVLGKRTTIAYYVFIGEKRTSSTKYYFTQISSNGHKLSCDLIVLNSDNTCTYYSGNINYDVQLPFSAGTEGQILAADSTGAQLIWTNIPVTDIQANGTSIISNGVANLVTETAYNSSTNKIATMSDVGTMTIRTWSGAAS